MTIHTSLPQRYLKIKEQSEEDRPREKMLSKGRNSLTKAELLGLIIGSGTVKMTAVDLARQLLQASDNSLVNLAKLSAEQLQQFQGIGQAKATLIISALELGHRFEADLKRTKQPKITSAKDAYRFMKPHLRGKLVEEFWIIMLNSQSKVIKASQISKGGLSKTVVDHRVVFKECLLNNSIGIILVHNHPSGHVEPSNADIVLTEKIKEASSLLGFKVLDHLIFGDDRYFSFALEHML